MIQYQLVIILVFLTGCLHIPDHDQAQLYGPVPLEASLQAAYAGSFVESGGWPDDNWWEMFADAQLNALITCALSSNPTLQQAWARVEEAEQTAAKTRASLLPGLTSAFKENWEYFSKRGFARSFYPTPPTLQGPSTVNQLDVSLQFRYELDFFGKNQLLFQATLGAARAALAEAREAALVLATWVAQTYIDLQMKLAQRDLLQSKREVRAAVLELTQARTERGLEPVLPFLEETQELYRLDQALLHLDTEILIDQHGLSRLIGQGPDDCPCKEPLKALFETKLPLPQELSLDLIARRPDLTAQLWRLEAAAQAIGAAKADFYPRIDLMACAGLESLSWSTLFSWGSRLGALTPSVHLPIFQGGRLRAHLKQKRAVFNEQVHGYNALILQAAQEVADAVAIFKTAGDLRSLQEQVVTAAHQQEEVEQARYKAGISDGVRVLIAEENRLSALDLMHRCQRDYLLAIVKVIKALGGGYRSEETPQIGIQ